MSGVIHVINPNSSQSVTDGISDSVEPLRPLAEIRCHTLAEGPKGIESQAQADGVIAPMLNWGAGLNDAGAVVIACFGDPGLHAMRDKLDVPVLGIQESGVLTALTLGQSFGVISILRNSVGRHMRAFGAMGVRDRCAGDRPLNLGVAELADEDVTFERMKAVGTTLRDEDGADTLILGCAGMTTYRKPLEDTLGLPVIEPCQAAVAMAIGQAALGWHKNT